MYRLWKGGRSGADGRRRKHQSFISPPRGMCVSQRFGPEWPGPPLLSLCWTLPPSELSTSEAGARCPVASGCLANSNICDDGTIIKQENTEFTHFLTVSLLVGKMQRTAVFNHSKGFTVMTTCKKIYLRIKI